MSLILKGIDLPKENEELTLEINHKGEMRIYSTELRELDREPIAIQISKPHGKVIDGGELNKSVHTWNPAYTYGRSAFTRAIDNAPTILDEEKE